MGNIERDDLRGGYDRLTRERDELRRMLGIAETVTQRQGEEVERLRDELRGVVEALREIASVPVASPPDPVAMAQMRQMAADALNHLGGQ